MAASKGQKKAPRAGKRRAKARAKPIPLGTERRPLLQEVAAILVLGLALLLLLALSGHLASGGDPTRNICGRLGHAVAEFLVLDTGVFSLAIPGVLTIWGVLILLEKRIRWLGAKSLAAIVLLLSLAALGHFLLPVDGPRGGRLGAYLSTVLGSRLSTTGSLILLSTLILASLVVATDWLLLSLLSRHLGRIPGKAVALAAAGVGSAVAAIGDGAGEDEEEEEEEEEEELPSPARKPEPPEKSAAPKDPEVRTTPTPPAPPGKARPPARVQDQPPPRKASQARTRKDDAGYVFPPIDLLDQVQVDGPVETKEEIRRKSLILEHTLKNFKIEAEVVEIRRGPVITLYELELAAGIKVSRISSYSDDLAMALAAESVRIVAPIPGKSTVGIEIPNTHRELVLVRDLLEQHLSRKVQQAIPLLLGKDAAGHLIVEDLAQMPHLLIAGATGSGKSVCINSIILSVLLTRSPEQIRMILIDPKMVELSMFAEVPHLLTPVVTDMKRAPFILEWAVQKMEERYELLAAASVRNIASFNRLGEKTVRERLGAGESRDGDDDDDEITTHLPYIVIVVDELADLMMTASKEIETSITRLCQKSRAVGIHIILATQRPSVDVITGLIKSNMPARISFKVASKVDSRTILDRNGAEKLLGQGDMLYIPPRTSELVRAQGTYVDDGEIRNITSHLKQHAVPQFNVELDSVGTPGDSDAASKDDMYEPAVRIILESQRGSVSLLQRALGVGYTRAARLIDLMAGEGLVGKYKGSQAREVLVTLEEWEEAREARAAASEGGTKG